MTRSVYYVCSGKPAARIICILTLGRTYPDSYVLVMVINARIGVVGVFVRVEGGVGFLYQGYHDAGPLVISIAHYHIGPGDPTLSVVGILAPVKTGICAGEGRVLGVCVNVCIGVVGVLVSIEGGVGCDYLANLHLSPLVPGLAFYDVCPGDPTHAVIDVLAPVEACGCA